MLDCRSKFLKEWKNDPSFLIPSAGDWIRERKWEQTETEDHVGAKLEKIEAGIWCSDGKIRRSETSSFKGDSKTARARVPHSGKGKKRLGRVRGAFQS